MFEATLRDGSWLKHAAHANAMATRLSDGLTDQGLVTGAGGSQRRVCVSLLMPLRDWMLARTGFYPFGDAREAMHRLMCSLRHDHRGRRWIPRARRIILGPCRRKVKIVTRRRNLPIDSTDTGTSRGSHGRIGVIRDERFSGTERSIDHR